MRRRVATGETAGRPMNNFRKRLVDVEEQQAILDWQKSRREFNGRSRDELMFFAVHGYFPESLEGQTPQQQEFTVGGIRTVITSEWVDKQ
jgi:hypothetical protein